jgi:hypothetical protein
VEAASKADSIFSFTTIKEGYHMNLWMQKQSYDIKRLLRTLLLLALVLGIGMTAGVSAEPLLSPADPFAQTDPPPPGATMLIQVQEIVTPLDPSSQTMLRVDPQEPAAPAALDQPETSAIPEPSSLALIGLGIALMMMMRRRKGKR